MSILQPQWSPQNLLQHFSVLFLIFTSFCTPQEMQYSSPIYHQQYKSPHLRKSTPIVRNPAARNYPKSIQEVLQQGNAIKNEDYNSNLRNWQNIFQNSQTGHPTTTQVSQGQNIGQGKIVQLLPQQIQQNYQNAYANIRLTHPQQNFNINQYQQQQYHQHQHLGEDYSTLPFPTALGSQIHEKQNYAHSIANNQQQYQSSNYFNQHPVTTIAPIIYPPQTYQNLQQPINNGQVQQQTQIQNPPIPTVTQMTHYPNNPQPVRKKPNLISRMLSRWRSKKSDTPVLPTPQQQYWSKPSSTALVEPSYHFPNHRKEIHQSGFSLASQGISTVTTSIWEIMEMIVGSISLFLYVIYAVLTIPFQSNDSILWWWDE